MNLSIYNTLFLRFTGAWYKHDNEDRPLFILRLGVMDVKGIIKSVSFLQIIYNLVWIRLYEYDLKTINRNEKIYVLNRLVRKDLRS